jgi:transposase-like protein
MTSKHKSEDYKLSAVEYYLVGDKSQIDVCKIFKCSPRSLMRWVEKYENDGEIKRENRKPVAYKVHKEHVTFLFIHLKNRRFKCAKV